MTILLSMVNFNHK